MKRAGTFLRGLTAGDVVHRTVLALPQEMSLVKAAQLLRKRHWCAAPVTDSSGRCVGVLSAMDILRWNLEERRSGPKGIAPTGCVWCDWQIVDVKSTEQDDVVQYMTRDALLVTPATPLVLIAKILLKPDSGPVVVVDEERRPLGVLSSKDILAALAFAVRRHRRLAAT
jgi:CBS domain-containing protein